MMSWFNQSGGVNVTENMTNIHYINKLSCKLGLGVSLLLVGALIAQAAPMSQAKVDSFVSKLNQAAANKSTSQIGQLIDNDAVIILERNGRSASLSKDDYLKLLQSSWSGVSNYRYRVTVNNVVVSGDQAIVKLVSTETWQDKGKSVKVETTSDSTLVSPADNAVLKRSKGKVKIVQ